MICSQTWFVDLGEDALKKREILYDFSTVNRCVNMVRTKLRSVLLVDSAGLKQVFS